MRKLTRARFGAHMGGGMLKFHGVTPVATHLDRFAVRGGVVHPRFHLGVLWDAPLRGRWHIIHRLEACTT